MKSRLHHIALVASNPERSARLFEELFGAEIVMPSAEHRGPPEVLARMPGVTLVFVRGVKPTERSDAHVALAVSTDELSASKAILARLGLEGVEPRHGPPGRALYFVDYDNNLYELSATRALHEGEA